MDLKGLASDLSLLNKKCEADPQDIADIQRYLNEGRCLIESLNPDFYAEIKTFKLKAGNFHQLCTCEQITKVIGQSSADCSIVESSKFGQSWLGCCAKDGDDTFDFRLTSIDAETDFIQVQPPVPKGADVYVTVKCLPKDRKSASNEDDICSCRDSAALSQWVLYRATLRDSDGDSASISEASLYLRTFGELAGLQYSSLTRELAKLNADKETS